jgi:D-alanyl-lipoteichoic acid acyltransferase DltB (MBOAT superfamily)
VLGGIALLFNSIEFLTFIPLVTLLYFLLPYRSRTVLLLAASCVFYMSFIPAYILILLVTILIDYFAGMYIETTRGAAKKLLLTASVISTCLVLFVFKYFNFVNGNITALASFFHIHYPVETLNIILPIGLSFHTFQSLSYVIEVYRGRQKAERDFLTYALYVMFFPQLVAGPIERPQNLLHQFYEKHDFDYWRVTDGLKLMAWGMFKKVVIADHLALYVNRVYSHPAHYQGLPLIAAVVFFVFQIYCDFSGYSDIALGSAQVLGFKLMQNFNRPYYARSIAEFWRRWHISLSSWFRDYVYITLGGNRVRQVRWYFNLFVTFLISGLWHGANWTFVFFGALNAVYVIVGTFTSGARENFAGAIGLNRFPAVRKLLQVMTTFSLFAFALIFFRANSMHDAVYIVTHLFSGGVKAAPGLNTLSMTSGEVWFILASLVVLETVHLLQRRGSVRQILAVQPWWVRWPLYYVLIGCLLFYWGSENSQFIYFQF